MNFEEALEIIQNVIPESRNNSYDGICAKKLAASNTVSSDRQNTHQTHIAITSEQMNIFPVIYSQSYNVTNSDNLKKYFVELLPFYLYKSNIETLTNSLPDVFEKYTSNSKCVRVSSVLSKREGQADQIQLALRTFDDSDFLEFRKLLKENDYLIILKWKEEVKYDCFGLGAENAQSLSVLNGKFFNLPTNTKVYLDKQILSPHPHNRIIFGAPGTGKSHLLEQQRSQYFDNAHYERVTFHPNYSYSQFVGAYKPVKKITDGKDDITYEYIPGPFVRVLAKALKNPNENFLLVIEEINRANVAAVFGDVFQLLDRDAEGKSEYPIDASEDLKKYLSKSGISLDDGKIAIPNNMYIWATMNSADQGVMPLDAAFKRRWEFEYIGIDENESEVSSYEIPNAKHSDGDSTTFSFINWNDFRKSLNAKLKNLAGASVNEDKLVGPFFISKQSLEMAKENPENFIKLFKSKVLMYLYEDVCKMNPRALFSGINTTGRLHYSDVCAAFDEIGVNIFGENFMRQTNEQKEN